MVLIDRLIADLPTGASSSGSRSPAFQKDLASDRPSPRSHRDLTLLIFAIVLFAAFSALRIHLVAFPRTINVKPDELRYLSLARSLFYGGSLVIRGALSGFQKILYPLCLFPALLFDDTVVQVKVIGILSSLYVCSAVFPAMLLAKRLFKSKRVIVFCMVLTLIMPDMCYSMTFLSESVYFPLALWLVVVLWKALAATGRRRLAWSSFGGALCYVAYLCKEIALAFVVAYVLVCAIMALRKVESRRTSALAAACFVIAFCCPFAIMKMTLFGGLGNSYNMTSPSVLQNPYTLLFSVYALANQTTHLIVAFAFFPIFFVALTFHDLSRDDRLLFLLCAVTLVVGLLTVVYTISIREEVGREALRPQLRYVSVLFVPMFFLFIKQIGQADTQAIKSSPRRFALLVGTTVAIVALVAIMFGMANLAQGFDNSQYHALRWFYSLFDDMDAQSWVPAVGSLVSGGADDIALLTINPGVWLSRVLVVVFIAGGTIGLLGRRRLGTGVVIVIVVAVVMIANNVMGYQYDRSIYGWDETYVEEASAVDRYLSQLPDDAEVLIVMDAGQTNLNNLVDTYIADRRLRYRYVTVDDLPDSLADDADAPRPAADYILVNKRQDITFTSANVEAIDIGGGKLLRLYHVTDDQPVTLAVG